MFERSPWIAERAWERRPFGSLSELSRALRSVVYDTPEERRLELIRSYPDLAGEEAAAGALTAESEGEHAAAGLDRLSPEEHEAFARANRAYKEKFGFPMVTCAREHTGASILSYARVRLEHSRSEEVETSLGEIVKIADLRLRDLVEGE